MAMMGTKENPCERGEIWSAGGYTSARYKLPHGWMVKMIDGGGFVPFAEDGTGWGKNDPADLKG